VALAGWLIDSLLRFLGTHSLTSIVIWDNSPVHRGPETREYLATPDLKLRMVALPAYSPDFNADEAIWDWAREEVTANICLGTAVKARGKLEPFLAGLAERADVVQRRCRTTLQAQADALMLAANELLPRHTMRISPFCPGLGQGADSIRRSEGVLEEGKTQELIVLGRLSDIPFLQPYYTPGNGSLATVLHKLA
jgi:hypothetical protein